MKRNDVSQTSFTSCVSGGAPVTGELFAPFHAVPSFPGKQITYKQCMPQRQILPNSISQIPLHIFISTDGIVTIKTFEIHLKMINGKTTKFSITFCDLHQIDINDIVCFFF